MDNAMNDQTRQNRFAQLEQACRDRGVPLTVQRRAVLEAVLDIDDHPTTDQVHTTVANHIAGISRSTVYRTLETLVRMGVIKKVCHPGSVVRYDSCLDVHHHLVCQRCDMVIDLSDEQLDALPIPDTSALGFEVLDFTVQLRGICRHCQKKEGS
jgi:Fur family peroxide stress response transcriptional regulator